MSETASLLAGHGLIYGEPFTLANPVMCACGELMPGGEDALFAHAVHRAHVAAIIDAHYAERERALVERVETELTNAEDVGRLDHDDEAWIEVAVIRAALTRPATEGEHG